MKPGSKVEDFRISTILNNKSSYASFNDVHDKLLILDFFGTWCVPCLKALPKLTSFQEKFKEEVNILLISEEGELKLQQFVEKKAPFPLPIIVDEKRDFIKRFQPPSYPYTVIINKMGVILATPSPEEVTEQNIIKWIKMSGAEINTNIQNNSSKIESTDGTNRFNQTKNPLVELSQQFVYAAKTGELTAEYQKQLLNITSDTLTQTLKTDEEKKAFWINIYNGYTQAALKSNPEQYKNRSKFFSKKQIQIANRSFSLDEIEHGILRRSKVKWGLGLLNKWFPGKLQKDLRVQKLDYRIHFALNCGAKSCPPIAFYKSEDIGKELNIATNAYLKSEVEYDSLSNVVKLPKLMSWFRYDFGGKRKMIALLKNISLLPKDSKPKIKFKDYNWDLYLQNYKQ